MRFYCFFLELNSFNLSQLLISDVDECQLSPCKNGGTCLNQQAGYSCKCKDGYSGEHCEEGDAYISIGKVKIQVLYILLWVVVTREGDA